MCWFGRRWVSLQRFRYYSLGVERSYPQVIRRFTVFWDMNEIMGRYWIGVEAANQYVSYKVYNLRHSGMSVDALALMVV